MNRILKYKKQILIISFLAVMLCVTVFACYTRCRAKTIGNNIGMTNGKIVGTAIGSAKGVTEGVSNGIEDGKAAGLSAEDTIVEIRKSMQNVGPLEVLVAEVSLRNFVSVGEANKILYRSKGKAVFTVDLTKAEIRYEPQRCIITIPRPELFLYIDETSTEVLAEVHNFSITVDMEDGANAYLNKMKKTQAEVSENLVNYEYLCEKAEEVAKKQVGQLVTTYSGANFEVIVEYE